MKKQFKLGVIGNNLIAQSIIKGAVLSDFLSKKKIAVGGVRGGDVSAIEDLGVQIVYDDKFIFENSEFQLICTTAEGLKTVAENIGIVKQAKVIYISDGLKKNDIKNILCVSSMKIARGAVNLPSAIGSGAIALDMSDYNSSQDDVEFISNLFNCVGTILSVDESKFDALTGLGINGAAYVFMFIDSLIDAGIKQGLKRNEAKIFAVQTVLGAAEMVQSEEHSLSELIMTACNNGSAALEGVKILTKKKFGEIIGEAVDAGVKKLKECD